MNLVEKLASQGQLSEEQVERIGRNVRDFTKALEDPSFLKEAFDKLALNPDGFLGKTVGHMKTIAPIAAATTGLGMMMGAGKDIGHYAVKSVHDAHAKNQSFQSMMEEHPHLGENPEMAQKAFNTLYRFNPAYAKDPLVAGTFVKNVLDQERVDIGAINSIVGAAGKGGRPSQSSADFFMHAMPGADYPLKLQGEERESVKHDQGIAKHEKALRTEDKKYEAEEAKKNFWEGAGVSEPADVTDPRFDK